MPADAAAGCRLPGTRERAGRVLRARRDGLRACAPRRSRTTCACSLSVDARLHPNRACRSQDSSSGPSSPQLAAALAADAAGLADRSREHFETALRQAREIPMRIMQPTVLLLVRVARFAPGTEPPIVRAGGRCSKRPSPISARSKWCCTRISQSGFCAIYPLSVRCSWSLVLRPRSMVGPQSVVQCGKRTRDDGTWDGPRTKHGRPGARRTSLGPAWAIMRSRTGQRPKSARSFSRTSVTTSIGAASANSTRRAFQSRLLTWSERTTPVTLPSSGRATSNG